MNNSEIRFTLDLQKPQSQVSIPVKLGDTARTLRITITDGGEPFVMADSCIAMLSAVKSNGYKIFDECIIEEGTIIRYDFNEYTATAEGITECEIVLYGDNNNTDTAVVVGSARFIMVVDAQVLARKDDILEAYTEDDYLGGFDAIVSAEVSRREAENGRVQNENDRINSENDRINSENKRIISESSRDLNEKARCANELKRQEIYSAYENTTNKLYRELDIAKLRISSIEKGAKGVIYTTVEESGFGHTVQVSDALPYGILSCVGGSFKWEGDYTYECSTNDSFSISDITDLENGFFVVSDATEIHFLNRLNANGSDGFIVHFVLPTNQVVKLTDASVYREYEDGSDTEKIAFENGDYENINTVICETENPIQIVSGNIHTTPVYGSFLIGKPYTLDGARIFNSDFNGDYCIVKGDTVTMPKGSAIGVIFPCALPKGTKVKVTANGENSLGEKVKSYTFMTETNKTATKEAKALGLENELTADSEYLLIYKNYANTTLAQDLDISDIVVTLDDPNVATLYDTYSIAIPEEINDAIGELGYGLMYSEECYNYLDLTNKVYHINCEMNEEHKVVEVTPRDVDLSDLYRGDIDVLPLPRSGLVRFVSDKRYGDEHKLSVPYTICYNRKKG